MLWLMYNDFRVRFRIWRQRSAQIENLRITLMEDQRWLSCDQTAAALTTRYLQLVSDDWTSQPIERVSELRIRLGLDPHQPPSPK